MKITPLLLIPLITLTLVALLKAATPAGDIKAEFVSVTAPDAGDVATVGDRAINSIGYSLVMESNTAVAKEGAKAALDKCHLKSLPASGAVLQGVPRIIGYKRTSTKLRDPANAPDAAEQLALDFVNTTLESGNPAPKILLQRITHANGGKEWRVYRPLGLTKGCVACHGPDESIAPEVREELKKRYPGDAATGYTPGQWRGLIRVTVAPQ